MKAADLSREYLKSPTGVSLQCWCTSFNNISSISSLTDQLRKTKTIISHPSLPVLASLENDTKQSTLTTIRIWNYELGVLLWSKTAGEVSADMNANTSKEVGIKSSFFRQGTSLPSQGTTLHFYHNTPQPKANSVSRVSTRNTNSVNLTSLTAASSSGSGNTNIKEIKFAFPTSAISMKVQSLNDLRLLVLTDNAVVLYNCTTQKQHQTVTFAKRPSAMEMIDHHLLLIGLVDGSLKLWNTDSNREELLIPSNGNKSEISQLLLIPSKGEEGNGGGHRLIVLTSDGSVFLYNTSFQDFPIKLGDGLLLANQVIPLYDFDQQLLFLANNDHKVTFWDLSEGLSASVTPSSSMQRTASNRSSMNRRLSNFTFKRSESTSSAGIYKLDKAVPSQLAKIESLASCYHPGLPAHCFFLASHTSSIAILQQQGSGGGQEDADSVSNAGGPEKAIRLKVLQEINVLDILVDHLVRNNGIDDGLTVEDGGQHLNAMRSLKIYRVLSSPHRLDQLLLATSYGPLVLSLHILREPLVGMHPQWTKGLRLTVQENHLKLYRIPSVIADSVDTAELLLTDQRLASLSTEASAYRPSILPSPSGSFVILHWKSSQRYGVFDCRVLASGQRSNNLNISLTEIEFGYASDIAWVGGQDHYLVKVPPFYLLTEQKRRSSIFGMKQAAPVSKVFQLSSLMLKQITSAGKVKEIETLTSLGEEVISQKVVDLFGGSVLLVNYLQGPPSNEELMRPKCMDAKKIRSCFFLFGGGGEGKEDVTSWEICSDKRPPVLQHAWNYDQSTCVLLHVDHTISVFLMQSHHQSNKFRMEASLNIILPPVQYPIHSIFSSNNMWVFTSYGGLSFYLLKPASNNVDTHEMDHVDLFDHVRQSACLQVHDLLDVDQSRAMVLTRNGSIRVVPFNTSDDHLVQTLSSLMRD
eukprot:scaffold2548_cov163-Ochromonas_danica.AAC.6